MPSLPSSNKGENMAVEFNTPVPVTILDTMRFVFFFKPQLVMDTFDHIPHFYVDVVEKAHTDNVERLYITCKIDDTFYLEDTDALEALAKGIHQQFWAYLKKHFGSKFAVIESPCIRNHTILPYFVKDIIYDLLNRRQMITEGVVADYRTVSKCFETDGPDLDRISPALLSPYVFNFWKTPPEMAHTKYTVLTGTAELFGEEKQFVIDNVSELHLPQEVFDQFISPRLIEDTINRSLRIIDGMPPDAKDIYIRNVKIDD